MGLLIEFIDSMIGVSKTRDLDMSENHTEMPVEMTVGEILRNARTTGRRKREIATVSKQLCIREEFLQALEDGNYKVIPETVYILGFARNYAMELGLDPDEIVNKLKREMGLVADCDDDEESAVAVCAVPGNESVERKSKKDIFSQVYKFIRKNWIWFTLGLVAIIVAVVASLIVFIPSSENGSNEVVETVQVAEVSEPKYNLAVRERFGTENSETANIILQANQESWVKVEDGRGNTVFSRVLVPGDIYYVPAEGQYKATFGNAGGVDVWVNGALASKQGANHVRKSGIVLSVEALMPKETVATETTVE